MRSTGGPGIWSGCHLSSCTPPTRSEVPSSFKSTASTVQDAVDGSAHREGEKPQGKRERRERQRSLSGTTLGDGSLSWNWESRGSGGALAEPCSGGHVTDLCPNLQETLRFPLYFQSRPAPSLNRKIPSSYSENNIRGMIRELKGAVFLYRIRYREGKSRNAHTYIGG